MPRKASTASSSTPVKSSKKVSSRAKTTGKQSSTKKTTKKASGAAASKSKTAKKASAKPAKAASKSAGKPSKKSGGAKASTAKAEPDTKTSKKAETTKKKSGKAPSAPAEADASAKNSAKPKGDKAEAAKPASKKKSSSKSSKAKGDASKSAAKAEAAGGNEQAAPKFRGFKQDSSLTEMRAAAAKLASLAGLPSVKSSGDTEDLSAKKFRKVTKSPLNAKQLAEFKEILLLKRAQLVGDVSSMELEALMGGGSGSLSHLPQHMADQGSDVSEQSLSLDLAASQRDLLREIDAALARIENGTYGICVELGKPIRIERLRETPWAKYSIEAARDRESSGRFYRPGNAQ